MDALVGDHRRRGDKEGDHQEGDQGFYFSMSVGVVFVRWSFGIFESEQHEEGREDVRCGLDGICNQCIGIPKESSKTFDQCQTGISNDAEIGGSNCCMFVVHSVFYFQGPFVRMFPSSPFGWIRYSPPAQPSHRFSALSFKKLMVDLGTS